MKNIFSIILIITMLFTSASWALAEENLSQPEGTAENPIPLASDSMGIEKGKYYSISNTEQLYNFAQLVNVHKRSFSGATVLLTEDIIVNDGRLTCDRDRELSYTGSSIQTWNPVGTAGFYVFSGTFDGQNHTISGLYVDTSCGGFFGYCSGAEIRNLTIANSYIRGTAYAGAFCELALDSVFENCTNKSTVIGSTYSAGICARANGTLLSGCTNAGTVYSVSNPSAWASYLSGSASIEFCTNTGMVICSTNHGMAEDNPVSGEKASDHKYDYIFDDLFHTEICTCGRQGRSDTHSYSNEVIKEPTNTENGLLRKTCTFCGYTTSEVLAAQPSYTLEIENRDLMDYVDLWNNSTFHIAAKEGAYIKDVIVNGVSLGPVTKVSFQDGDIIKIVFASNSQSAEAPKQDKELSAAEKARIIKGVQATTIKASSVNVHNGSIRITWKKSPGYKVDYYQIFRSTKKNSGYGKKAFYTTKTGKATTYTNSKSLKVGTRYYYKVRGVRVIDGKKYYTQYSNKANRRAQAPIVLANPPY